MPIIRHGQLQGADRGDMLSQHTVIAALFDVAMSATPHEGGSATSDTFLPHSLADRMQESRHRPWEAICMGCLSSGSRL